MMRNPYWTVLIRPPFSIVIWSVFGFNVATSVITLSVPRVPLTFTAIGLSMLVVAGVAWMALAIRERGSSVSADRRR